ncbi:hypothetical protein FHR32_000862 [Streptosporangium album]|uniref:Uncharacterized protein n=1 Tax=Streptosporangium album TaxID=47479 RepID=A0A7W7RQY9_9ACTN|nr:hypothetical protein [Streptosporangium album]MBB4936557.1 hypothetical protein [Streptosporangium album]
MAENWPLSKTELARRWKVDRGAVTRAWQRSERDHQADPAVPAPPQPVNPGEPRLRYLPSDCDPWWAKIQRPRGRPTTANTRSALPQEGPSS